MGETSGETAGLAAGEALGDTAGDTLGDALGAEAGSALGAVDGAAALETFPFGNAAAKGGKSARGGEILRRFQGQVGTGYGHFCG